MKKNMKKNVAIIPLTLRGKKRYVLFHLEVEGMETLPREKVELLLLEHLRQCYGTLGLTSLGVKFIAFDMHTKKGIIRCSHTAKEALITALVMVGSVEGKKAFLRTLSTSGSLKTLKPLLHSPSLPV